ncbi:MAG: hypothetical protein EP315_00935 [Gammaproteobacteria bacterium]|nr:MAG: hypothetical protein EP315_00935 [Gammaproteobacteria bacterium]
MKQLAVLVPGLLGPLPELQESTISVPRCDVLETWLARSEQHNTSCKNYYQQLAELLSINADFSIARVSAMVDGLDASNGYWYRADPVHFKTEMDHAILLDQHMLDILQHEAESLIDHFNRHFFDDGLRLVSRHPARWYLHTTSPLNIAATQLHEAIGRNVTHFLPRGEHALRWRRLLNETQMLFHEHDINTTREAQGKLTINSLWLWGEGAEMHYDDHKTFQWLMCNEPVAIGLASVLGIERCALDEFDSMAGLQGNGLMIIDDLLSPASYGDVEVWAQTLQNVCELWLRPLHRLLHKGVVQQINLYAADGRCFTMKRYDRFRFWRRQLPITAYIADAA